MATMLAAGTSPMVNGDQQTVAIQVTPHFTRPVVKSYHPPVGQPMYMASQPMGRPLLAQHVVDHREKAMSGPSQPNRQALANTKEKTPMCLVNELARFNKLQHQYTLTDEQGPAHKKTFYVKLQLGTEEYSSSGASIKKAQHAAAEVALENTQYKKPPSRPSSKPLPYTGNSVTPTVELNALAMKRGEPAVYRPMELPPFRPTYPMDYRIYNYNPRYQYPRYPRVFQVQLEVGPRKFVGEGPTRQAARHEAATKALRVLQALPMPKQSPPITPPPPEEPVVARPQNLGPAQAQPPDEDSDESTDETSGEKAATEFPKSEISQVHEIALKRGFNVTFEVVKEAGPPHLKQFLTKVNCGEFTCEGEGNSKKLSKKRAAEKLLEKLRELPPLPPQLPRPKKAVQNKKKNRGLIKLQKASPEYGQGINPISRLIQIQQAKKEAEPIYSLLETRGQVKRREFVMEVAVANNRAQGVGPNKKLAKRNAAEAMLILLGYSRPMPKPSKPALKPAPTAMVENAGGYSDKRVTFMEGDTMRQMIPGVLIMPKGTGDGIKRPKNASHHDEAQGNATKQQLLYAAEIKGLKAQFTEFPKSSKEFVCLVSLSTNPPQVCQGIGSSVEEALELSVKTALTLLGHTMPPDQPRAIVAQSDQPRAIVASEQPRAIVASEQPRAIVASEQPRAIVASEQPRAIVASEQPRAIVASEQPRAIVAQEQPRAIVSTKKVQLTKLDENMASEPKDKAINMK